MSEAWAATRVAPALAVQAAALLAGRTGVASHDIAIILGSGWRSTADVIGPAEGEIPLVDLPGFAPPAVEGHGGTVRSLAIADRRVPVFLGRTHYYQRTGIESVVHNVHIAHAL